MTSKQIPSRRHELSIPVLGQTTGFAAALREHCGISLGADRFWPDGFVFDLARRRLTIYEVVITHDIDAEKLRRIRLLRSFMRQLGWMLRPMTGSYGDFWPMDMRTGGAVISAREQRASVRLLDRGKP